MFEKPMLLFQFYHFCETQEKDFKSFSQCELFFDFTKFKKFFGGMGVVKTMFKGSKTDEKVTSLKVKLTSIFLPKIFFQFLKGTIALICLLKSFKKKSVKQ